MADCEHKRKFTLNSWYAQDRLSLALQRLEVMRAFTVQAWIRIEDEVDGLVVTPPSVHLYLSGGTGLSEPPFLGVGVLWEDEDIIPLHLHRVVSR